MAVVSNEHQGLSVKLERLSYAPDLQTCEKRPHAFQYSIRLHNSSMDAMTIRGRKWVLTTKGGDAYITEAEGVQGEFPRLEPGADFSYESFHLAAGDTIAEGAYLLQKDDGTVLILRVPAFLLQIPVADAPEKSSLRHV